MNVTFKVIGIIVITTLMIAIPILTACSFCYGWVGIIKFLLTILTTAEWYLLLILFIQRSE